MTVEGLDKYWTEGAPYQVFTEDHSDFYANPPIRPKVGEFANYVEAVEFAKQYLEKFKDSLQEDPMDVFIMPEPAGLHFDCHEYEKTLFPKQ